MRITFRDQRVDGGPGLAARWTQLPPVGANTEVVDTLQRAQHEFVAFFVAFATGRDDLEQQFMATDLRRVVERAQLGFLLHTVQWRCIRIEGDQALDDVFTRPGNQLAADGPAALQFQRVGSGYLDRTPDPPTTTGGGVQRILSIAVVGEEADMPLKIARALCRRDGFHQQFLQFRKARFVTTDLAGELEERRAMVEGEDIEFVPTLARYGRAVQVGQLGVQIGAGDATLATEERVEFRTPRHGRRAT